MSEELSLKPCPFCGGEAKIVADYFNEKELPDYIAINCNSCFAWTHSFIGRFPDARRKAIEAWNRRA